jgi:hypothetical protein
MKVSLIIQECPKAFWERLTVLEESVYKDVTALVFASADAFAAPADAFAVPAEAG